MPVQQSRLLDLPLEIRLVIYEYACLYSGSITISSWSVTPFWPADLNRAQKRIPGVSRHCMPVAKQSYDSRLLKGETDLSRTACVTSRNTTNNDGLEGKKNASANGSNSSSPLAYMLPAIVSPSHYPPPFMYNNYGSLQLTCRQIHNDLATNHSLDTELGAERNRNLRLYLSYPEGVCIAVHRYPHLLRHAKAVFIVGLSALSSKPEPLHIRQDWQKTLAKLRIGPCWSELAVSTAKTPCLEQEQSAALALLISRIRGLGQWANAAAARAKNSDDHSHSVNTNTCNYPNLVEVRPRLSIPFREQSADATNYDNDPTYMSVRDYEHAWLNDPLSCGNSTTDIAPLRIRLLFTQPAFFDSLEDGEPINSYNISLHRLINSHNSHSTIWSSMFSPIMTAENSIIGGLMHCAIERNWLGIGVDFIVRPRRSIRYRDSTLDMGLNAPAAITETAMWNWLIPSDWEAEAPAG